jgi:hypothetical protein
VRGASCFVSCPFPITFHPIFEGEVDRDANQDDHNARNRRGSTIDEQDCQDANCADEVKQGNEWITEGTIRAFDIWLQLSQAKYAGNGENVKDQGLELRFLITVVAEVAGSAGD